MTCVVTFYSHFGAVRYKKLCDAQGLTARLMPVPRSLSSSCGTCVRCEGAAPLPEGALTAEVEQIVEERADGYRPVYRAENG